MLDRSCWKESLASSYLFVVPPLLLELLANAPVLLWPFEHRGLLWPRGQLLHVGPLRLPLRLSLTLLLFFQSPLCLLLLPQGLLPCSRLCPCLSFGLPLLGRDLAAYILQCALQALEPGFLVLQFVLFYIFASKPLETFGFPLLLLFLCF